jgi:hypothetical protein
MPSLEKNDPKGLTETQKKIVCTPANTGMLVLAGPGTGKTHTLVHRVLHLVQQQGLVPYSDLLVLSFSRTAIAEIRQRISVMVSSGSHDDLRFLNIRTFDSFSTKLLISSDENVDLSGMSYDDRIQLAVRILATDAPQAVNILKQFRHVIVDEIQDLVGVRAQLVQQILRTVGDGFSLFGDPAQGIFDYLVKQSDVGPTSIEFLSWVKEIFGGNLVEESLDKNFRIQSSSAAIAFSVRGMITDTQSVGQETYQKLQQMVNSLESIGSVDFPDCEKLSFEDKSTTLLCRTNSDVLFATSRFIQHGIACIAMPHKNEQGIPMWIGRILAEYKYDRISRTVFESEWQKLIGVDQKQSINISWKTIKSIEDGERDQLDLNVFRSRLRKDITWSFDSESSIHKKNILITTIHQSKGREYDNVIILSPDQKSVRSTESNAEEEAKILYVAATRAREKLFRLDRNGIPISLDIRFPSGKERLTGQSRIGKHLMEISSNDVDPLSYAHEWLFPNINLVRTVQSLIWKYIQPGTQLSLVPQNLKGTIKIILTWKNPSTGKQIPIAWLTDQFKTDLDYFLNNLPNRKSVLYKPVMEGAFAFERITVVLPPFVERIHDPWKSSGVCIGLGIKGAIVID